MIAKELIKKYRVEPGSKVKLKDYDTGFVVDETHRILKDKDKAKEAASSILEKNRTELSNAQDMLYADDRHAVLVILQAMDAAGKDGTIKHVMSGINPQGCQVFSFKKPSDEELDHNFLWRCMTRLPERGRIGIFNRSYYEEVLVAKVHPAIIDHQKLPDDRRGKGFWKDRYEDINSFEQHLVRNGTAIVKFFLHVSKKKQKERFLERLDRPEKNWKFSASDLAERKFWDDYMKAYEDALGATSTDCAPWYVIPADHKWITRTLVADILVQALAEAKRQLESE
jgi:PPK2 family polyphosphate:nucleotide phosphotransferase